MTSITSRAARAGNRQANKARGGARVGPTTNAVAAHIEQASIQYRPHSTQDEYKRYVAEYLQFCAAIYEDTRTDNRTVDVNRVTNFLVYHAERPKRTAKKGQRHTFSKEDYESVMNTVGQGQAATHSSNKLKSIDSYYAALVNFADDSMRQQIQACSKIKKLLKTIAPRRMVAERASHKEKTNPELDVFGVADQHNDLEQYYWDKYSLGCHNRRTIAGNMRNRYTMLDTFQELVRAESMWPGKLSDAYHNEYHATGEPDPYDMLFRSIYVGKTNGADKGKILTARSIRHLDAKLCAHGAYAFYLFARFNAVDEYFDLSDNRQWFDIVVRSGILKTPSSSLSMKQDFGFDTFWIDNKTF